MKNNMKTALLVGAIVVSSLLSGCASCARMGKTINSNFGGGLDRTVTVYDYNGNMIKSYSGKFDVTDSENEVAFDYNNKRVIIQGGIVINEEK